MERLSLIKERTKLTPSEFMTKYKNEEVKTIKSNKEKLDM